MLKDAAKFILFNYISLFLNTLRGIVLITLLNPFSLGIYRLIFTYTSYFRYYNLGLNALAFYRAPPRGMQQVYSYIIHRINLVLATSLGFLFTLAFVFFSWDAFQHEPYVILFFVSIFVIIVTTQIGETCVTIAKIGNRFNVVNTYNLLLATVSFALMLILGLRWELRGVIVGLTVATAISCVYILVTVRQSSQHAVALTKRKIVILFKHGVYTILPGMLSVLFSTVEVWLISERFGIEETGYYSVVMTFVNVILLVNTDGLVFLYARKSKEIKKNAGYVLKVSLIAFAGMTAVCIAGIYALEWGTAAYFPKYIEASVIYQLCFWGIPFLVFKNLVVHYISNNKAIRISVLLLLLLIIKTGLLMMIPARTSFYSGIGVSNLLFGIGVMIMFLADNRRQLVRRRDKIQS